MYLGLKEMRYEKLRYSLLTGVMLLIALVVFIISGLANGLSAGNRLAVDQWQATSVYLNQDANKNLSASQLTMAALDDVKAQDKAPIALEQTVIRKVGSSKKIDISMLASTRQAFVMPKVTDGKQVTGKHQLIISQNLKDQGIKIGDRVRLGSNKQTLKIVGSYGKSTYSIVPTIYTDLRTMTEIRTPAMAQASDKPINAIVTKKSDLTSGQHNLQRLSNADFIQNLPGYSAEQSTLNAIIYFLFGMSLAIIGIFMYVLTLQKQSLFGVLKVEGIGTAHILASVVTQAAVMALISMILGMAITIGFGMIAPSGMPFALNYGQLGINAVALFVASVLGALLSWRTIAKINPVTAIK